ncbi:hypothetical protein QYE76_030822 [Lolium multiflorum]|uniref:Arabidopsis retrotransposon Orf1 C-terminal domain-containing protein n=1 Tax=Lolium multiflorum TaxID=4521 RepID=A0AAD8QS90_LOLMU|nr:hypothetical protein QYE76_030822 [Lolium multiflorum]
MGKPRDPKVAILPSTTRKGTTLSTSAALDSPSVIDKLVSPPHASHAGTSARSENSYNIDDASAVLDDSGSLGSFLDATIARSRQIENAETPNENAATPVNSPESVEYSSDNLDEDYVELDDDFIDKCNATTDARKIKKLLAQHTVRYKLSPDPKFATSPINIKDKDYDFSLDLSHISIVEKTPFCGTEKESAVEHMIELSTLSSLFSDDVKKRTYFVAKIFPFSLKDDAKTWKRTPDDAEELLARIGRNHDDWSTPEPTPTPILKKRGMIKLNDEDMREAKKSLKEKGIKSEDVKNLPPIEDSCKITPPSSMIEVHSLERFTREDIPYSKPPAQCLDEFDNYIVKQSNFNMRVENHLMENSRAIGELHGIVERTSNDVKMLVKHFQMVQTQIDQLTKVQNDLLKDNSKEKHAYEVTTRGGVSTQDPLYPEGHPKRVEQDSQRTETSAPSKKKKKKHKTVVESSEPVNDPNSISISDAETESGNEHDKDKDKNDASDKEEVEEEPEKHAKNKKYTKEDFIAKKHGLLDDFLTLVGKAGLTTYVGDESEQYYTLTKIFVESFKFNKKHFRPTVAFKIYGKPITMKLEFFCAALGIAPVGTSRKIEDNPKELLELYRGITNDDCRTIQRGKIRNIQLPAIKYFAYYIATSILGRENTSNISSYHLGFLIAALTRDTPYHLGALVARRLSNKGPIFGGIIASRILAYLELPLDPTDVKITPMRLDIAAMKSHQFVTTDSSLDNIVYRILFADGEEREILLPQPDLFSIDRKPWSRSKEEVDEQLKIQGFHQQHDSEDAEPSYDYTVTYPGASSSTYPEYDPSSSYYGGATSWAPWD